MGRIIVLLLLSNIFLSAGCRRDTKNCHHNIAVYNTSNKPIYASISATYPDTSITVPNPVLSPETHKVAIQEKTLVFSIRDCVEVYYKYLLHSDTLVLFVFDASVLESNSWETVKQNDWVLKRYLFSLSDLKNKNFTIDYP
ncbi:hypothetical protein FAM09_23675 [Niastella caeni]|uniref:Lipoprotein n=1 Tax=Niastella caeni TaxID=2569763 RepID=A0A4S8HKV8_9BACT|nr:hypothetical protein [Niastella caeni]THU34989.1 hypothetical protein FAM09_23675 [Niastella caeni]